MEETKIIQVYRTKNHIFPFCVAINTVYSDKPISTKFERFMSRDAAEKYANSLSPTYDNFTHFVVDL